jgi:tellurite resistance-related uncharacterized protein
MVVHKAVRLLPIFRARDANNLVQYATVYKQNKEHNVWGSLMVMYGRLVFIVLYNAGCSFLNFTNTEKLR